MLRGTRAGAVANAGRIEERLGLDVVECNIAMEVRVPQEMAFKIANSNSKFSAADEGVLWKLSSRCRVGAEGLFMRSSKTDAKTSAVIQHDGSHALWALAELPSGGPLPTSSPLDSMPPFPIPSPPFWSSITNLPPEQAAMNVTMTVKARSHPAFVPCQSIDSAADIDQILEDEQPGDPEAFIGSNLSPSTEVRDLTFEVHDTLLLEEILPDAAKGKVSVHLFNGRLSLRMHKITSSHIGSWIVHAVRGVVPMVPHVQPNNEHVTLAVPNASDDRPTSALIQSAGNAALRLRSTFDDNLAKSEEDHKHPDSTIDLTVEKKTPAQPEIRVQSVEDYHRHDVQSNELDPAHTPKQSEMSNLNKMSAVTSVFAAKKAAKKLSRNRVKIDPKKYSWMEYGRGMNGWKGKFLRVVRCVMNQEHATLLHTMFKLNKLKVRSVKKSFTQMHSADVFVLDAVDNIFVWYGAASGASQREAVNDLVKGMKLLPSGLSGSSGRKGWRRAGTTKIHTIVDGLETEEFWFYLGGKGDISRVPPSGEAVFQHELPSPRAPIADRRDEVISVAIIGGGVTGCTTAAMLKQNGLRATIVEASENVGGLLAENVAWKQGVNTGCPFITARSGGFLSTVQQWVDDGVLLSWMPQAGVLDSDGRFRPVSVPGPPSGSVRCTICGTKPHIQSGLRNRVKSVKYMQSPCCWSRVCTICWSHSLEAKSLANNCTGLASLVHHMQQNGRTFSCPVCRRTVPKLLEVGFSVFQTTAPDVELEKAMKTIRTTSDSAQVKTGTLRPFASGIGSLRGENSLRPSRGCGLDSRWLIGRFGMGSICRDLASEVTVATGVNVVRVARNPGKHSFSLFKALPSQEVSRMKAELAVRMGKDELEQQHFDQSIGSFDFVLFCTPAHVTSKLTKQLFPKASEIATSVRHEPIWVIIASFAGRVPVPYEAATVSHPTDSFPITWVCRESSRASGASHPELLSSNGLRTFGEQYNAVASDVWVLHATSEWSNRFSRTKPRDVAATITGIWLTAMKIGHIKPTSLTSYLWEQGKSSVAKRRPRSYNDWQSLSRGAYSPHCLWDPVLGIGVAGDWMVENSVEGAWTSGRSLATLVLQGSGLLLKSSFLHRANEDPDHLAAIEQDKRIQAERDKQRENQKGIEERTLNVIRTWMGTGTRKAFDAWRQRTQWKKFGKAAHMANINSWRKRKNMSRAWHAWMQAKAMSAHRKLLHQQSTVTE